MLNREPSLLARPFLCRSPLFPGESLYSLLVRLAALNRLSPQILTGLCFQQPNTKYHSQYWLDNPEQPLKTLAYERLAIFTGLPLADLYAATVNRYSHTLKLPRHPPQHTLLPGNLQVPIVKIRGPTRELRGRRRAQFCPVCLSETKYHRLIWSVNSVSVCLTHKCFLASECFACENPVSIEAAVTGQCLACQADLTCPPAHFPDDAPLGLFAQHALEAWLEGKALLPDEQALSLPRQPPYLLYHFVRVVRYWLLRNLQGEAARHLPYHNFRSHSAETAPEIQYELTRLAMHSLINWPINFLELMRRLKEKGKIFANSPLQEWAVRPPRLPSDIRSAYWKRHGLGFVSETILS